MRRKSESVRDGEGIEAGAHATGGVSRRSFLGQCGLTLAAVASGAAGLPVASKAEAACVIDPDTADGRADRALQNRIDLAQLEHDLPLPDQTCNGDEDRYPTRFANYSKGLPHDALGGVQPGAYDALLAALASGDPAAFESIPMGSSGPRQDVQKLVNPQAGLAFDLQGADSHHLAVPPAPAFASAEAAGEIAENYWMALCRDVPFASYDSNVLTQRAADSLSALSDFRGPKEAGRVTTATLFRGFPAGDVEGPFISQFLWLPAPFGATFVEQRMRTPRPGIDFLTRYDDWLGSQNGALPRETLRYLSARRYVVTGRDLAQWVHIDVLFQAYFVAALILMAPPGTAGGIGAPANPGNPYLASANQIGFATFGGPNIATLVCEVATRALKATWYQKWFVHRRLRPEAFAGRVHNHVAGRASYPLHRDILDSDVLTQVRARTGSHLLPMAYPEGCPMHPAYSAGHATVAGACVTILKALFDENAVIPNPVVPSSNNPGRLVAYQGPPLTVGNELNKLASNVGVGRDIAGVHWRSDYAESLRLGEEVAISLLRDQSLNYNESFAGYTFTRFDGTSVTV